MPVNLRTSIIQNQNFVGRSEILQQINKELLPDHPGNTALASRLRFFALCGFGGLGKTQIATFYAFERENAFDAIFWVQASDVGKFYKSFRDIAEALNLIDEGEQGDMAVSRDKVLHWLSDPRKQQPHVTATATDTTARSFGVAKWLMIFDNADSIDLIREFWPPAASGSILVTSRDPLAKTDLATEGIDLRPMTGSECALLLQKKVDESTSPAAYRAALSLVTKLGNVPLAVSQIATRIRRNHMTIEEYLGRYGTGSLLGELNKVTALPPKERYGFTVATVWGFEDFSPHALGLMRVMAFMDPDAVAENILEQNMATNSVSLADGMEYLCSYPEPGNRYVEVRLEILRTSQVSRNNETKTLGWHRQVREVTWDKMTGEERYVYYQIAIDLLYQAWEFTKDRFNRESFHRKRREDVLPHVHSMIAAYNAVVPHSGLPLLRSRQLVKLLQETGWYG